MFISKTEKAQITGDIKLVKAMLDQLNKEIRVLATQITNTCDMLKPPSKPEPKKVTEPKKVVAKEFRFKIPQKFSLSPERVQAMKQSGVWDDVTKRYKIISQYILKDEFQKQEYKRLRQREYNRRYKAKKQIEKQNANSVSTESK